MVSTDLQVILKDKDLAEHMFSIDNYVKELLKEREGN